MPMLLEQQLFWLVCFGFYVADNLYFLGERELLIHETFVGSWAAKLAKVPFTLGGKHTYFTNPLMPHNLVLRLHWLQPEPSNQRELVSTQRKLWLLQRKAANLRIVAVASFVNLFFVGPILTGVLGLGTAFIIVALVHVGLIGFAAIILCTNKAFFFLTTAEVSLLAVECIFCPAHLVNIVRKIGWRFRTLSADRGSFCCVYSHGSRTASFCEAITYRLDEMIAEAGAHSGEIEMIESYKKELRI
jgi:hypothetical protein